MPLLHQECRSALTLSGRVLTIQCAIRLENRSLTIEFNFSNWIFFNKATGMAICCPITNTSRAVPFHGSITGRTALTGFVMCEQVKSLDLRLWGLKLIERAPQDVLDDVLAIIDASVF